MIIFIHTKKNLSAYNLTLSSVFFHSQLVCEEVNVDRFYPVLYPKVSSVLLIATLSFDPRYPAILKYHESD